MIIYSVVSKYKIIVFLKSYSTRRKKRRQVTEKSKLDLNPASWCLTNSESHHAQDFHLNHASLCLKILADDSQNC